MNVGTAFWLPLRKLALFLGGRALGARKCRSWVQGFKRCWYISCNRLASGAAVLPCSDVDQL